MNEKLLYVCMGNICRSPTAKGIFDRALSLEGVEFVSESAGTHDYHVGHAPDRRAIAAAAQAGIDISGDLARQLERDDFYRFSRIFCMDRANLARIESLRPADGTARVQLLMELAPGYGLDEVPDPYYGGAKGFVQVIDMLEAAAAELARELAADRSKPGQQ
ncbi:MAG: low molecular weight protein-tyrosine-phosphatase [Wenzhouxiangellaceae bacterium]|nr:low molecular weight protein-tyrosine-phosphatase [Wenzhouxiangellaceae bacterium]